MIGFSTQMPKPFPVSELWVLCGSRDSREVIKQVKNCARMYDVGEGRLPVEPTVAVLCDILQGE
jgi:hypothetical protein